MLDGDTGLVEVLVFEVQDRELIGHVMDDGSRRFCCTADLASKIRCKKDRLIVKVRRQGGRSGLEGSRLRPFPLSPGFPL